MKEEISTSNRGASSPDATRGDEHNDSSLDLQKDSERVLSTEQRYKASSSPTTLLFNLSLMEFPSQDLCPADIVLSLASLSVNREEPEYPQRMFRDLAISFKAAKQQDDRLDLDSEGEGVLWAALRRGHDAEARNGRDVAALAAATTFLVQMLELQSPIMEISAKILADTSKDGECETHGRREREDSREAQTVQNRPTYGGGLIYHSILETLPRRVRHPQALPRRPQRLDSL